jgi:hypothetical protein
MTEIKVGQYYRRYTGDSTVQIVSVEKDLVRIRYHTGKLSTIQWDPSTFFQIYPKRLPAYLNFLWRILYG